LVIDLKAVQRTHTCGELRASNVGETVRLNGWLHRWRNHGGLLFVDLRDRYGLTQVVFRPEKLDEKTMGTATHMRAETVIAVEGTVGLRPEGMRNEDMPTGEIEIAADKLTILNESKTPPFEIEEETTAYEELRLKYRYLDLRRNFLKDKIILRHKANLVIRNYLHDQGFLEIETPMLMRSTPEGARDYIVPARTAKGKFYALPQSPQLLKQILMISGFDKYFQLARCLRDEDLRADRQPEHTQIDMEMSFVTMDDIFAVIEGLMKHLFKEILDVTVTTPFPRLTYRYAI
jgi:aspartyl-tRNA synthetase